MKLAGIFRFELAYQLRRPWPWLFFVVLLALSFLMTRDAALADALYEDFFVNSPFAIASTTVFGSLIWLLVAAPVAGEAGARDVATRMYPLVYTASASRAEYLGGRFLAALALNAFLLLAVQTGMLLAVYSPGVPSDVVGPFRPAAYLTAYAFLALPNAFLATAIQFALAVRSGRTMTSYVGSLLVVFMGFFVAGALLYKQDLGTLLDPIGIRFVVEDLAHAWTTIERNTRLLGLEGRILTNRLLWLGVALATLALLYLRFRFAHRTESSWWRRLTSRRAVRAPIPAGIGVTAGAPISVARVARTFGVAIQTQKTLAIAWTSFRTIAMSPAGVALLGFLPLLAVPVVLDQMEAAGIPVVPITARVLGELIAPLSAELSRWVIVPLLIVFFAGELVWREREAGVAEITDAMPGSEWAQLLGKFLGLGLVLVLFLIMLAAAGMIAQTMGGHQEFEVGLYLTVLLGLQLPEYLLFALLALVVHVLVNEKYIGHLVAIMAYVFIAVLAGMLGIEHNLLVYGAAPGWSYTDMRGFGPSIGPWLWFKLYWAAWALLLAVLARLLWSRGKERGSMLRIRQARGRFTGSTVWVAGVAVTLVLTLGGFIYYNTNVLNRYQSRSDIAERRAEYERRYRRYERIPQPSLVGTVLRVEIHPERRAVEIRGSYRLVNGSAVAIDSIHVATATGGAETGNVTFDRAAALAVDDKVHGYRIYALSTPLAAGDTLTMNFEVGFARRGFANGGIDPLVAGKGSSFTSGSWFPFVGYQAGRELVTASDRRKHALPERPVIASLYDEAREPASRGGGISFEATIGTAEDQVAVAPGALRRTWTEGGRRYFHYSTDAPIGNEWSFFSAQYAVREARWNDVAIRVYHHPGHTGHLDRVTRGVRASLKYYSAQFGPYPYRHLTVVEQAGAPGTGLHADASMISHGEAFPLWNPTDDQGRFDFPYAVIAHEMAHQWTLPYAAVEGAPFLSEGLAWYSAMQAVKASLGDEGLQRLLEIMRQPSAYPPIRRGEPLLRALDPYLSYRKGPFAMYTLSEYVGTDRVNGALRRLIARHDSAGAPRATTLDLYRELGAVTPDSMKPLLRDLFETNTFWQLGTDRATVQQTPAGTWQVTVDVRARKMVYDSAGVEREVAMDELVEIGVFAEAGQGGGLGMPIYRGKHRVRSGVGTITVTVPRKPGRAGIDPYHLLDWEERDGDDNLRAVTIEPARTATTSKGAGT